MRRLVRVAVVFCAVSLAGGLAGCTHVWDDLAGTLGLSAKPAARSDAAPAPGPAHPVGLAVTPAPRAHVDTIDLAALPDLPDMQMASGGEANRDPAVLRIEQLGDEVLAVLEDPQRTPDDRIAVFRKLLARDLDVDLIARFALGRYWNTTDPADRDAYRAVFSHFLVQTYATRLGGLTIDDFEVVEARTVGDKDIIVRSRVDNGTKRDVRADWRLRKHDGKLLILDLSVEGISMAVMLRQEFASILRKKGFDGLMDMLRERVEA